MLLNALFGLSLAALSWSSGEGGQIAPPTPSSRPQPTPVVEATPDAATRVAEGDYHFALRSIGAVNQVADPFKINLAITAYREALKLEPANVLIVARLLRALHFRGAYTGADLEEKKAIFDEGRRLGQDSVDRLEVLARNAKGLSRIEALRLVKGSAALYLWTAGHWGEWGLARGKFTAARTGVAGKIRDLAQTVIDIDPLYEDAAGYRILGRLHSEAPKIIFITGWVSHEKGLDYLRRAYAAAPEHPVTLYFLAEAILDHEPGKRNEALSLLEQCARSTPDPDRRLEDERYAQRARERLDELNARAGRD